MQVDRRIPTLKKYFLLLREVENIQIRQNLETNLFMNYSFAYYPNPSKSRDKFVHELQFRLLGVWAYFYCDPLNCTTFYILVVHIAILSTINIISRLMVKQLVNN
jgi:hypothetical protein